MPYDTRYNLNLGILYFSFIGHINVDDLRAVNLIVLSVLDRLSAPQLHIVIDVQAMTEAPNDVRLMSQIATSLRDRRIGFLIVIRNQQLMSVITGSILARVFGIRYRAFDNLEQLFAFMPDFKQLWDAPPSSS